VIAFVVAGPGGGSWSVAVGSAEGHSAPGPAPRAALTLRFRSADIACRVFTLQLTPVVGLLWGAVRVRGDLRLAARLPRLFSPT
jgi:hypothetical protein